MSFIIATIAFLITIGILVAVHEYGHFWVARKLGVKVLRYSIGFGKLSLSSPGITFARMAVAIGQGLTRYALTLVVAFSAA